MYCQSCGAQNATDARFCNKCGARIATAGQPGGPLRPDAPAATIVGVGLEGPVPAAAPAIAAPATPTVSAKTSAKASMRGPPKPGGVWAEHDEGAGGDDEPLPQPMGYMPKAGSGNMTASVSLQAIGVQSSRRTWMVIATIALALVALGAGGAWIAMKSGPEAPATTAPELPPPEGPIEIGTPLPTGVEAPSEQLAANTTQRTGTGTPARTGTPTRTGTGTGTTAAAKTKTRTGTRTGTATTAGTGTASGTDTASGSDSTTGSGSGSDTASGTDTASGSGSGSGSGSDPGSGTGTGTGAGTDTVPEDSEVEEPDIEMTMYAANVRRFIRSFYATRAQGCFEHATRNDQNARGTVIIAFTIGATGQVTGAEVQRNTTENEAIGRCLATQVNSWRLPQPPGNEPLQLSMPFSR